MECLLFSPTGISQAPPKAQLPVLTTSAGQSNDVNTVNAVLEEADIKYDYCDVPTVEMLQAGVGLAGKQSAEGFHVEVTPTRPNFPRERPTRPSSSPSARASKAWAPRA